MASILDNPFNLTDVLGSGVGGGTNIGAGSLATNPGWFDKFKKMLVDPEFRLLLGAVGADLAGMDKTNAALMQTIGSGNALTTLSKMFGSGVNKISMTPEGTKIELAPAQGQPTQGVSAQQSTPSAPAQVPTPNTVAPVATPLAGTNILGAVSGGGQPSANPFLSGLSQLNRSDVMGLSPETLLGVVGAKFREEELKQKKVSDTVDALYKQGLLGYYETMGKAQAAGLEVDRENAITNRLNALRQLMPEGIDEQFPVKLPGVGNVTNRQWASLPDDVRQYALYHDASTTAGQVPMAKAEFDLMQPTERIRTLRALSVDSKLLELDLKLREAGASKITVGDKVREKLEIGKIEPILQLLDPKAREAAINAEIKKLGISDKVMAEVGTNKEIGLIRNKAAITAIEKMISVGNGAIEDVEITDTEMIWTVRWPTGNVTKITERLY